MAMDFRRQGGSNYEHGRPQQKYPIGAAKFTGLYKESELKAFLIICHLSKCLHIGYIINRLGDVFRINCSVGFRKQRDFIINVLQWHAT